MIRRYSHQLTTGVSFGLTSSVITALGMIVGLHSATCSRLAVIAAIVIMAVADGLSDATGVHISEESELERGAAKHNHKEVWAATFSTFISKAIFTLSFVIPFLIFPLKTALFLAISWGILLLILLNLALATYELLNGFRYTLHRATKPNCIMGGDFLIRASIYSGT